MTEDHFSLPEWSHKTKGIFVRNVPENLEREIFDITEDDTE